MAALIESCMFFKKEWGAVLRDITNLTIALLSGGPRSWEVKSGPFQL